LVGVASINYSSRFRSGIGVVGKNTVFYKKDAESRKLLVNPFSSKFGEIFFEFIDYF